MTLSQPRPGPSPTAIILAAGGSTRMGTPKGLLRLGNSTLIERHIEVMRPYSASIVVVLGAAHDRYHDLIPSEVRVCVNPYWAPTEQADSIPMALSSGMQLACAWLVPVDCPPASPVTLERLLDQGAPAVPVDKVGRRGHPALLGLEQVARLHQGVPEGGARGL